ncbi:MAG TPA: YbhB/YbcL family Raf kinase inhibitor-like protein [Myxococcota bacterium]|nr:YbhB/YbcL family Raf kinase inhibitor-like protein [Myxococcota bacterium]
MGLSLLALAAAAEIALHSSAFADGGAIPQRFTCEGENVSPALEWGAPPSGAKSLALVVDDPEAPDPAAPKRTWVHWVVYDLPASTVALAEGAELPSGARHGQSDFGEERWRGPCPPIGNHHYHFKLYALDAVLGARGSLTKAELEKAMAGHVLARSELIGTYQKQKP